MYLCSRGDSVGRLTLARLVCYWAAYWIPFLCCNNGFLWVYHLGGGRLSTYGRLKQPRAIKGRLKQNGEKGRSGSGWRLIQASSLNKQPKKSLLNLWRFQDNLLPLQVKPHLQGIKVPFCCYFVARLIARCGLLIINQ